MTNPLTKEAFAEWCERQPAGERYPYLSRECACGQYAQSIGIGNFLSILGESARGGFWDEVDSIASERPRTFGALAKRLRS